MAEHKRCSYSLRKTIKQAQCQYRDKVESELNSSDTRCMWQSLQTITVNKRKTSHIADTVLLPDKLNTFFARFEDNTVPPMWPATKDCGLSFSMPDVSKTFKHFNPHKAAQTASLAASSEHAQTSWLVCLRTYSISPVCCSHMLQDGHHFCCIQESHSVQLPSPHSTHFCRQEVL